MGDRSGQRKENFRANALNLARQSRTRKQEEAERLRKDKRATELLSKRQKFFSPLDHSSSAMVHNSEEQSEGYDTKSVDAALIRVKVEIRAIWNAF